MVILEERAAGPSTPAAGHNVIYPKTDGLWYFKSDDGVETPLAGAGIPDTILDAKGDLISATAADSPVRLAVGSNSKALVASSGSASGLAWAGMTFGALLNGSLTFSVAANALTIALKGQDGADPSATNPVSVLFRNPTAATVTPDVLQVTAASSLVVSSGSTLGALSSTAFRLWIVAFNDAGTLRLGVINCLSGTAPSLNIYPLAGWGIASSTAEGGAGAADAAAVFYTGTAVASKAYAVLGYATFEAGLTTAGTWAIVPTRAQLFGSGVPLPGQTVQTQRTQTGAVATGTTFFPLDDTIPQITEGTEFMTCAITPTSAANVLQADSILQLNHSAASASGLIAAVFQDAGANALAASVTISAAQFYEMWLYVAHRKLAASTSALTFSVRAGPTAVSTTVTFNGRSGGRHFGGVVGSFLSVAEIMA